MLRWASRILLIVLIVILSGVTTGLILVWTQTRREYVAFSQRHEDTQAHLLQIRAEREAKEAYLRAFLNDPDFLERVIRERMRYVAPGEIVFRFENR
jgi:cell division protein FtsB